MKPIISNFSADFKEIVKKQFNSPALILKDNLGYETITYGELDELIDKCVHYLVDELSLKEGSKIVTLLPNSAEMVIVFLATIRAGMDFAPLSCNTSDYEINRWINIIDPDVLLATDLLHKKVIKNREVNGAPASFIKTDGDFEWLSKSRAEFEYKNDGASLYISTSGSTGAPKALVIDSNLLWSSGRSFSEFHNLSNQQIRIWNYLPMSYLGGLHNLALIPLSTGGSILIDEPFNGGTFLHFWQTVERYKINTLWLVPTIVQGLLKFSKRMPEDILYRIKSSVNMAFIGTAPISLNDKVKFEKIFGIPLLENYGLSETTFITSERLNSVGEREEGTTGEPLPYVDLKFKEKDNWDTADGNSYREICVRSPYLFKGYLNEKGDIEKNTDSEGFFRTGDIGTMTDNKQVKITGRVRDVIKKGGLLVSLSEVEKLAKESNLVGDASAVKIPHSFYGESYILYIVPMNENDDNKNNLVSSVEAYLQNILVKYKWPEKIVLAKPFPRTESGKVQKHLIKEDL